jgi:sugar phosphate isomerase/epimerase
VILQDHQFNEEFFMTNVDQIAIQLYTVRELAAENFANTLKAIADIGYKAVELAGFHGHSASEIRGFADEFGLRVVSAHIAVTEFQSDLSKVISDLQTLGAEWGVVPWISPENRTEATLRAYGDEFNEYARRFAAAGLKFGYHNHDFEFKVKADDGTSLFETLLAVTDPETVKFELDAYWVSVGGLDPADVLRQHKDRIKLVHLKDGFQDNLVAGGDVPFGEGNLDFTDFFKAAEEAGIEYYITEQDTRQDVIPEITASFRNAEKVLG